MVRVCQNGGRVGMSAWGAAPNPAAALWNDIAGRHAPREQLNEAFLKHIPWDTWFSLPDNVALVLRDAGLGSVFIETRYYFVGMPTTDYLLSREASVQGLVLRRALSAEEWNSFRDHAGEVFEKEFGEKVEYQRDAHFGAGTKVR
jgi:hypothetical protein